jgi:hypothetical protein
VKYQPLPRAGGVPDADKRNLHRGSPIMKQIRLSGREVAVIRAIGFSLPLTGAEILEHTRLSNEDLTDILNGLMVVGYVESTPYAEEIALEAMPTTEFEVNSAYSHELKAALGLHRR